MADPGSSPGQAPEANAMPALGARVHYQGELGPDIEGTVVARHYAPPSYEVRLDDGSTVTCYPA